MSGTEPPARARPTSWVERAGEWLSEEALAWLLVLLVVDMFVLPVLGPDVGEVALNVVFTVLLFTGLATVASRGVAFVVIGVLALCAAILKWIAPISGLPGTPAAAAVAAIVIFSVFTLLVLLRTLSPGPITRQRIQGAIATYLLIAMTFAFVFGAVELLHPGSLDFNEGSPEGVGQAMSLEDPEQAMSPEDLRQLEQAVGYFSMVTLTTVGYGDVTPVSPLARQLAMLEGVIGQLYPAIIIGWMVGSMKRRDD